ncbi:M14 family zinc carboxypeptidase [Acinetobacter indicus]|uniref:M14 family zinc carboxypeptidase n=1 Tax=Acinetobacter indicus TaxID=756892 RepID=UPI000CEC08A8|nr:M14 family zinc carboxypeptidase [Acinetobacter indicus]
MPLPTAAELTDPNATNAQMKERLGRLAENVLDVGVFNAHAMLKSKTIAVDTSGTDLDDITEPGIWICNKSNLNPELDKNFPIYGSRTSGLLVVYVDSKPNFSLTRQIYITADNFYFRGTFFSGWTDWKELLTSATLNDQLSNVLEQSEQYASEKATTAEKNAIQFADKKINQLFILDFHSEDNFSSVVVDQNNNIVLAIKDNKLVTANADEFLRDFHTEKFKATYVSVDKNFNILNSGNGDSSGLDTTRLQDFAFYPDVLKTGEVYSDFGFLRDQKNWDDDLYKLPVSNFIPNHQAVYAFYDQLVNQNPTRFAMEVIGHDALDNEIRQYTYTPRALISVDDGNSDSAWDAEAIAPPKLVVLTGVHGGTEKEAILQLMIFINEIFNRYTEIEEAALLRQARLIIIPCSTPSAIDRGTRQNHAGVDVNRNARDGFQGAGGTALSQPECALAVDLPNRHPDAACFIDFHNYSTSSMSAWFATHGLGNSLNVLRKVIYELNIMTPARFPFLATKPIRFGRNANGTIARDWQLISGKKGYLIETAIDEGVYPSFELRQHGLTVLRKSLSAIYLSEFEV